LDNGYRFCNSRVNLCFIRIKAMKTNNSRVNPRIKKKKAKPQGQRTYWVRLVLNVTAFRTVRAGSEKEAIRIAKERYLANPTRIDKRALKKTKIERL
jgi:hypothetical protein